MFLLIKIHIIKLAESLGLDVAAVEDMILIDEKFDQIDNFFQLNGKKIIMFYYQEPKVIKEIFP